MNICGNIAIICDNIVNIHNIIVNIHDIIANIHSNYREYSQYVWGDMGSRKSIPTDYVQTCMPFLLLISIHYIISTDHVDPLYHVYRQLLIEKECGTLYIS